MWNGKQREQWIHTTHLLLAQANAGKGKGDTFVTFDDVYPWSQQNLKARAKEKSGKPDPVALRHAEMHFNAIAEQMKRQDGGE